MNCHYFFENQINNDEFVFNFWPYPSEDMKIEYPDYPARLNLRELIQKFDETKEERENTNLLDINLFDCGCYIGGELCVDDDNKNNSNYILLVLKDIYPLKFEITLWENKCEMIFKSSPYNTLDDIANANLERVAGNASIYTLSYQISRCSIIQDHLKPYEKGDDFNVRKSLGEYF